MQVIMVFAANTQLDNSECAAGAARMENMYKQYEMMMTATGGMVTSAADAAAAIAAYKSTCNAAVDDASDKLASQYGIY